MTNTLDRRHFIGNTIGMGLTPLLAAGSASAASALDTSTAEKSVNAYVKMIGSQARETVYATFSGTFWAMLANEAPLPLCGFHGIARADWVPQEDGSFMRRTFDVGMFNDLETLEALDDIENPLTGETVQLHHFKYGGSREHFSAAGVSYPDSGNDTPRALDKRWQLQGDQVVVNEVRNGAAPHPLRADEWPKASSGEKFLYGTETTYLSPLAQMTDNSVNRADYQLFWSSITSWEPWMMMGKRPGFALWRASGRKLERPEDAAPTLLAYVEKEQPNYFDREIPWEGTKSSYTSFKETRKPASS